MSNEKLCRLCLELISSDTCQDFDDIKLEMLQFLFLRLDKDVSKNPIICSNCVENLQLSFDFKTSCLTNSNYFKSHVYNCNSDILDSVNVSMKGDSLEVTHKEKIICKFCLNSYEKNSFKEINRGMDEDLVLRNMFEKCLPEIDINIEKQLMCQNCLEFLQIQFNFIITCLDNKEKIRKVCSSEELEDFSDILIEIENLKHSNISNDVKLEPEDVNIEEYISNNLLEVKKEEEMESIKENEYHVKEEMEELQEDDSEKRLQTRNPVEEKDAKPKLRGTIKEKKFLCDICSHQSTNIYNLKRHYLIHKEPSEVNVFKCDYCPFATKWKNNLIRHTMCHKNPSELPKFKCNDCPYETSHRQDLVCHFLVHKNHSQVNVYKCKVCRFQTKHKSYIRIHRKKHQEIGKIYTCDKCNYISKFKRCVTRHLRFHKESKQPAKSSQKLKEVRQYKCNECFYVGTRKRDLITHQMSHKDLSEREMYNCTECSFQALHKTTLRIHYKKKHSNLEVPFGELKIFQCNEGA